MKKVIENFYLQESFYTNTYKKEYIALFSNLKQDSCNTNRIYVSETEKPEWVKRNKQFWKDDKFYYGVGEYTLKGVENDTWITAQEIAIYNLIRVYP